MLKLHTKLLTIAVAVACLSLCACQSNVSDEAGHVKDPISPSHENHDCIFTPEPEATFSSFSDFASYTYNAENPDSEFYRKYVVNFDTLIPNSQIIDIEIWSKNSYTSYYSTLTVQTRYRDTFGEPLSGFVRVTEPIENFTPKKNEIYVFAVGQTDVFYKTNHNGLYVAIEFVLKESHQFYISFDNTTEANNSRTDAQNAFIEAFFTEAGTADMLAKIEALIPEK